MKRKFELRECFVCRREAYKCQVQTNIIVLCGGEKKIRQEEEEEEKVPSQWYTKQIKEFRRKNDRKIHR